MWTKIRIRPAEETPAILMELNPAVRVVTARKKQLKKIQPPGHGARKKGDREVQIRKERIFA